MNLLNRVKFLNPRKIHRTGSRFKIITAPRVEKPDWEETDPGKRDDSHAGKVCQNA